MELEDRIAICSTCKNRSFDRNVGLVCGLTNQKPEFEESCESYDKDNVREVHKPSTVVEYDGMLNSIVSHGARIGNLIIDSIVILLLQILIIIISDEYDFYFVFELNGYVFSFTVFFFYYLFLESIFGITIGKMITGTKVVSKEGYKADGTSILARTICRLVPLEAFSFLGDDSSGWHDKWSGTKVVKRSFRHKVHENIIDEGLEEFEE